MLNLIKMDLYKMLKLKITWVILIIAMLFSSLSVFLLHYEITELSSNTEYQQTIEQMQDAPSVGIQVSSPQAWLQDGYRIPLEDMSQENIASNILLLLLSIFTVSFTIGEMKFGFLKSISGQIAKRGGLVISKLVCLTIYSAVILAFFILSTAIGTRFFFGYIEIGSFTALFGLFGLQFVLHTAFAMLIAFVTILIRNSAGASVFGICCSLGISTLIASVVTTLIHKMFRTADKFQLSDYLISKNVSSISYNTASADIARAMIVAAVFLICAVALSALLLKKRDIA
ncbi:MAG: hypothetical protein QM689_13180 [Oscillospiraceae bacterium]